MPEEEIREQQEQEEQEEPLKAEEEELLALQAAVKAEEEKRSNGLAAVLTMLICLCLIAEVVLASYIGLTLYRNRQTQQQLAIQYEAYLDRLEAQQANPPKVQYIGPTVRVVDGVLVENYRPGSSLPA